MGREQELADLISLLEGAGSGRGSLILLTGEPGIGKTRLLSELGRVAREAGFTVASGRCWEEGGAPPYWPWIQVLRSIGGDLERLAAGSDAARSRAPGGVMPEGERLRLFDEVCRVLAAASSDRPLLVTVDDIHAADEPSLLLLRYVGETLGEARILVAASYRDGERRVRELAEVFGELVRVGERVPLRGLTWAALETYVGAATGAAPTRDVVERLHEITGGNPFFVGEVVRLLAADEVRDAAITNPLLRIPEEVRALIRRRVATLPPEAVGPLRIAAVLGREFDLHLLQHATRLSPGRLMEALGEAVDAGVITEVPQFRRRYSFAHELVRETLYDDVPPGRRLELHRDVGRLLETVYADDLDRHISEVARHLYLAAPLGEALDALDYLVRAGERAAALFAYEEAVVHYGRALELLPSADVSGERRTELELRLGDAQWRSGNGTGARTTFESAIEESRLLGNGGLLARATLGYVTALGGFLLYARFEVGGTGVGLLQEALASLPAGDSSLRAHLLAHLALEMWSGHEPVEERVAVSEEAIEMARRLGDSEALVTALHARHWVLTTPGMALERLSHTGEMLRVAKETMNAEVEFLAHNARFHCFLELCDRRGMDAESQAMTELADRLRQPFYRWHTICLRTLRATLDGRFADAERLAQDALELGRVRQSEYAAYVFRYAQMLALRWAQGRLSEHWPEIHDHAERYPWIPRWREPLAAAELGDEEMARRELDRQGSRGFVDLPRDGLWILHLVSLAEAAVLVGDLVRAAELYELLLPHAEDNAVSYTQQPFGPVALRLGQIAALLGRWQEADRHFATALARCELLGARAIRARVLLEQASALATRGEPADLGRLEANLDEAAQLCDELAIPALRARVEALQERFSAPPASVFRREGDVWTIVYEDETFRLRDVKGLGYIATLLASPGRQAHVLELVNASDPVGGRAALAADAVGAPWSSDFAPLLDEQAKREYGRRLDELEDEIDEARRSGDDDRAARLAGELEFLTRELRSAVGLHGRDRTFASPQERARVSVTKAIKTAIKLIDKHSPSLAAHLDTCVQTGRFCSYATPGAAPPEWLL
ncbi:MAG TPA: AAA family ATPase [Gaiellaceae bacterium]|nr:AAA family ATPase [Gaiellaceae bacterium]